MITNSFFKVCIADSTRLINANHNDKVSRSRNTLKKQVHTCPLFSMIAKDDTVFICPRIVLIHFLSLVSHIFTYLSLPHVTSKSACRYIAIAYITEL